MNWIDYAIIGVLGLSVVIGLWRGLVAEVLALVVWAAAFWVAWVFGPAVASHFGTIITLPSARIIAGYGLCFVAVLVLGALLRFVVARLVAGTGLSGTDRLLGMIFGFVRGVLLVTLLVFLIGFTAFTRDPWWQQSVLLPHFQHVATWLEQRVPAEVRNLHAPTQLSQLPRLPASLLTPISDRTPAPASTARPAYPAAAGSAPAPHF
jgi:membrane protein required for colicin V production